MPSSLPPFFLIYPADDQPRSFDKSTVIFPSVSPMAGTNPTAWEIGEQRKTSTPLTDLSAQDLPRTRRLANINGGNTGLLEHSMQRADTGYDSDREDDMLFQSKHRSQPRRSMSSRLRIVTAPLPTSVSRLPPEAPLGVSQEDRLQALRSVKNVASVCHVPGSPCAKPRLGIGLGLGLPAGRTPSPSSRASSTPVAEKMSITRIPVIALASCTSFSLPNPTCSETDEGANYCSSVHLNKEPQDHKQHDAVAYSPGM